MNDHQLPGWREMQMACDTCAILNSCRITTPPSICSGTSRGKRRTYFLCNFKCSECGTVTVIEGAAAQSLPEGDIRTALLRLADIEEKMYHDDLDSVKAAVVAAMRTDIAE